MFKKYKDDLMEEFADEIKDCQDEFQIQLRLINIIYEEQCREMPKSYNEYGWGNSSEN